MNRSPKHIVTTRKQNISRSHLANRTKTAVDTASGIIGNHGRRISAQTEKNRLKLKWSDCVQESRMSVHVLPYLIAIVEESWLWLDATSEPQGLGGPMSTKNSANYRDEATLQSFADTMSRFE